MDITEKIKKEKDNYVDYIKKEVTNYKHIIIYGAGRKGIGIYHLLKDSGIHITAFSVTRKEENKDFEKGLPVYGIDTLRFPPKETLFIIGVRKRWNEDVIREIKTQGYINYIEAPDDIEYFTSDDLDRSQQCVMQITAQAGCSINCAYCPQYTFIRQYSSNAAREKVMTFDLFKYYLSKMETNVILEFAGFSEPYFNKDCTAMLKYADKRGHRLELFTTLVGMSYKDFEEIRNICFREVVLHIPDKQGNSRIEITEKYLELLKEIMKSNKPDGRPFADWASCHGEPADEIKNIVQGKIRILTQLHDRAGNLKSEGLEQSRGVKGHIKCSGSPNLNHNVLLPDGTVLLCDSDWGMKHVLGSLNNQTYKEILNGEVLNEIKQMMLRNDNRLLCRKCCYATKNEE